MIQRTILEKIKETIRIKPVTVITGARQVGKSTLCKVLKDELGFDYVSFDDRRELQTAKSDPLLFVKSHKIPLIVDEVQKCPELFSEIERVVNEKKFEGEDNSGMFVLTGSQAFNLMQGVSESMAGRVGIITLLPLSAREVAGECDTPFVVDPGRPNSIGSDLTMDGLYKRIVTGFFPEIYDKKLTDIEQFYNDYVTTYIERDVSQILAIKDKLKYQRFMELLASCVCEEVVYDRMALSIGISTKTAQEWTSSLVASGIIRLLEPFFENSITKRVVKRPKLIFNDTGLAAFLSGLSNSEVLKRSRFNGHFVENYIINEIIKSYNNSGKYARFYYYRDSSQSEIDLIVLSDGMLNLIECKAGIQYSASDIKSFSKLSGSAYPVFSSGIVCLTDKPYLLSGDSFAVGLHSI